MGVPAAFAASSSPPSARRIVALGREGRISQDVMRRVLRHLLYLEDTRLDI